MKIALLKLFDIKLSKLSKELSLYTDEKLLWKTIPNISNTGGNLCLHLIGNLNYYIGSELGNTEYIRNREALFTIKNIPLKELQEQIETTKQVVKQTIESMSQSDFDKIYPLNVFGEAMTTTYFLIHLTGHFNYHLGQLNYHRRVIC